MTSRRRKRRDFDAVYYMGIHNRSGGGGIPTPPAIRALRFTLGGVITERVNAVKMRRKVNPIFD